MFNKAYSYEVLKIEPLEGTLETTHTQSADFVSSSKGSITIANLLKGVENSNVEPILKSSKVVNENGEPKVVYHQTNSTIYRNVETGENWDDLDWREKQEWKERDDWDDYWQEEDFYAFNRNHARTTVELDGFFFAPNYDEYHEYGERTIHAFLNIRKPASQEDYNIDAQYNDAGRNRENDALIFLVFTDFESGRIGFPGVSLRSTLGYFFRFASRASHVSHTK